jgi:hypothetical protein
MMKSIFKYGLMVSMLFLLTGCQNIMRFSNPSIDKPAKLLLSEEHTQWMRQDDYKALQQFIERAQPNETMQWRSRTTTYTAISRSVFLNESGRPCRCYQLQRRSWFNKAFNIIETACRNANGVWVRVPGFAP